MADISPQAITAAREALGVAVAGIPKSVAIIMDGNGRWATSRGLPRSAGHHQGATVVGKIVSEAAGLGLDALTLYSFSIENWRRPREEVSALMHIYAHTLAAELPTIMAHNIRLRHLGRREGLPGIVLDQLDQTMQASSKNTGMFLSLALNYGSRDEIVDAVKRIAGRVQQGELSAEQIDAKVISDSLDTTGIPDPDLLIRTAGEMRLSNFLLWQISYAELFVTDVYWPDFDEAEFRRAIIAYAGRSRRFGGLDQTKK
jgi:undecaprenyl diphosphate synthase